MRRGKVIYTPVQDTFHSQPQRVSQPRQNSALSKKYVQVSIGAQKYYMLTYSGIKRVQEVPREQRVLVEICRP